MKHAGTIALIFLMVSAVSATAQYYTTQRADSPPHLDGFINESVWDKVEWAGDFIQHSPHEGQAPSAETLFKILYDDENLYVAFRAFDPEPDKIGNVLSRRDHFPGDWVEINIDSYFDHRTAFSFTASVSGTQGDEFISEDGNNWDTSWDPIWEHQAQIDDKGWTCEMRIPLSQLRYGDKTEHIWGIQITRRIYRYEERSTWAPISRQEWGWVSKFGELRGITGIKAQKQIELLPYVVSSGERFLEEPGNPYADGQRGEVSGGIDGKIGVTGDLILDFTINPDFGQVEADPSQVNLTAFETFFQERRPFFIEGSNILRFRVAPSLAYGTHTMDRLFYSRRIGGRPAYYAGWDAEGYIDQPDQTSIIGAFKLAGKTKNGLSIGLLETVTAKEQAEVELDKERHKVTVQPLTNYFVGRLQQDFRRGDTRIGVMATAVNRKIEDPHLEFLHEGAYAGGIDFNHYLNDRSYYLAVNLLTSRMSGSREAMIRTQRAPARYFQRPDNKGQSVDSTATSLGGHGGSIRLGKSSGNLNGETGLAWRSPGFDLNDAGFMRNADEVNQFSWIGYSWRDPFSIFNEVGLNFNQWFDFEYAGDKLYQALNLNSRAVFKNNWRADASISWENERISNWELRGGPSMKIAGNVNGNASLSTDSRKTIQFRMGGSAADFMDDNGSSHSVWGGITWRPSNAIRVGLNPSYSYGNPEMQYVATRHLGDEARYIYGSMERKTAELSLRIDYTLTPKLTIQYYGAPFVSAGNYNNFKRVSNPRADRFNDRIESLAGLAEYDIANDSYTVDEDLDGTSDYSFDDPDFNVKDFNSNLVIRWEYSPGSSLYLVWSQARFGRLPNGDFALSDDLDRLFEVHPHNIFLLKVNRWFDL